MSLQQKDEIPSMAEEKGVEQGGAKGKNRGEDKQAVGGACDSEDGSREGGETSVGVEAGVSEEEEKESEREAQTDGGKEAGELIDERGGGKGEGGLDKSTAGQVSETGKEEDGKKEGKGEKSEEGESKGKEQEGRGTDGQAGGESSQKGRVGEGTGLVVKPKRGGEVKDKPKVMEAEKQTKPKKKAGPNPTAAPLGLSRPRSSARSHRGAAKRDIIAKFQQNCPETPVVPNFKVQRTSAGLSNGASIKQKILQWCRSKTRNYEGVCIENFSSSWCDGLAFCALVHRFFPDTFDFSKLRAEDRANNFALAFNTAESLADCCPLLEVEDMLLMGNSPDPLCVFTYVQALCQHLSKIEKERKDRENEGKSDKEREGESVTDTKEEGQGEKTTGGTQEGKDQGERGKEEE